MFFFEKKVSSAPCFETYLPLQKPVVHVGMVHSIFPDAPRSQNVKKTQQEKLSMKARASLDALGSLCFLAP